MANQELSISVGELLGIPKVSLSGYLDGWHDQAILGILNGLHESGANSIVLDVACLNLRGIDGTTSLVNVLRMLDSELCVHMVASSAIKTLFEKAEVGSNIYLYSNTDEIAEEFNTHTEYLTSRWVEQDTEDTYIHMAA